MNRTSWRTSLARLGSLLLLLLVGTSGEMLAKQNCTNADFFGPYGFLGNGAVIQPPPGLEAIVGPFARIGRLVSYGDGTLLAAYERGSYNGVIFTDPFDGVYSVKSDCTISFLLNAPAPIGLPIPFTGVIMDDGDIRIVTTAPGALVTATIYKQGIRGCSAESLFGSFVFELSGVILPARGPYTRLGKLVADGGGNFAASTIVNNNGLSAPEGISGTYRIDSECKLILNYKEAIQGGAQDVTVEGVLRDRKTARLLVTKPLGVTITGTLAR
jgi:hypothetical protein